MTSAAHSTESLVDALLASLSHDLKTRLTVIAAAADNLRRSVPTAADQRDQSELILAETVRVNWILQNIIEVSHIETSTGGPPPEWCDPMDIVIAARGHVEHHARSHPIDVTTDVETPVWVKGRLAALALAHVLENAAQYSPDGSAIDVTVRSRQGELVIEVGDHGPGIGQADLPRIFDRCYRGALGIAVRPGTGLGLWIASRLLAANGGRVRAGNRPGGGAQFTISLPSASGISAAGF